MIEGPFERAVAFVLPHEEDFVRGHWGDDSREEFVRTEHDPDDPGGTTRYGIDQRSHPGIDVEHLTRLGAIDLYRQEWEQHQLDLLPEQLAIAAFDVHVNGGQPGLWLQHAWNVTHQLRPGSVRLAEDNNVGPATVAALQACTADEIHAIIVIFLEERDARFQRLAEHGMGKYLAGWLQRDLDLSAYLLQPTVPAAAAA